MTLSTARTRLTSGPTNVFKAGLSDAQKNQRINEVLDRFYEFGTWSGLRATVSLTPASGIISLAAAYRRLDKLFYCGARVPIRSQVSDDAGRDASKVCDLEAIDLGDNSSSVRRYQLTGNTTTLDTYTFTGLARKRFIWLTSDNDLIIPDSYQALRVGVQALGYEDEGDYDKSEKHFAVALGLVDGNLKESYAPESWGSVLIDPLVGMGCVPNLM